MKLRTILLLVLLLCCTGKVFANSDFEVVNNVLVKYNGAGGNVVIPDTLGITAIGEAVFNENNALISIVIPNGVTEIKYWAFTACANLVSVTFPNSLVTIEQEAFLNCNSLISVIIPSSVSTIGLNAFGSCKELTSIYVEADNAGYSSDEAGVVYNKNKTILHTYPPGKEGEFTIPASVTTIGQCAFYGAKLSAVTFHNAVTTIEQMAFRYCPNLNPVSIPASVSFIGHDSFEHCSSLTAISVDANNTSYSSEAGVLYDKNKTTIMHYPMMKASTTFEIPGTVTTIGRLAFYSSSLTSVTIPNSVTIIQASAFWLSKLTSVTIPASVTSIDVSVFGICNDLKDVTVGWETPLTIPDNVFLDLNTSSVKLHVPAGTKALYQAADVWKTFGTILDDGAPVSTTLSLSTDSLNFTVDGGEKIFEVTSNANWTVSSNAAWLTVSRPGGSNTDTIMVKATANTADSARTATITVSATGATSQTIRVTQAKATSSNSDFEVVNNVLVKYKGAGGDVVIPDNLGITAIGERAFYDNDALISVVIPNGVTEIRYEAFLYCQNLVSVTFPNSLAIIGGDAFLNCYSLVFVTIPSSVSDIGYAAFGGCNELTSIHVDAENAVYSSDVAGIVYNKNKTTLHIYPSGKTGEFAIPASVAIIGECAFYGDKLSAVTFHNAVTTIRQMAFRYCRNLSTVSIPASVSLIGDKCFEHCSSLTTINVDAANTSYSSEDGVLYNKNKTTIIQYPMMKAGSTFEIPGTVTTIGSFAFYSSIPISITIPNSVTTIQGGAFWLSKLTSVTIPASVTTIDYWAFGICNDLKDVIVAWTTPLTIHDNVFFDVSTSGVTLHVPAGTKALYQVADVWKTFGTIIEDEDPAPDPVAVTGVSLNTTAVALYVDSTAQLTATVAPTNATNKNVSWSSNNESVATVSAAGLITARSEGTATITVTTQDGKFTATCSVEVTRQEVVIEEEGETGADGKGKVVLSLSIPSDVLFTGTFRLTLPNGVRLDMDYTHLAGDLATQLTLVITQEANGNWLFSITPNSLKSASETVYRQIMEIGYIVDESVALGSHDATISNLQFALDNGTNITENYLPVKINVTKSITGNPTLSANTNAYIYNDRLYIDSPVAETVQVYSVSGALMHSLRKPIGKADYPIGTDQHSILIIKGNSGWVRKVVGAR